MKIKKYLLALLTGSLLATAVQAQVEVTVTGSTAFRSITIDRAAAIFDPASLTAVTNNPTTGLITFSGTMANLIPALGSTQVKIRLSFSGSASGMLAVKNSTPVSTAETPGVNVNKTPDLALSDVFPGAASPPIAESAFDRSVLGVVPMVFVRNNVGLTGVNNITRDQAVLFMTASGAGGMPASYLGGSTADNVYLIGRDSGSGTRITVEKCIKFVGTPVLWGTNGAGAYITTGGLSSGGLVRSIVGSKGDAIGYLSRADYLPIAATTTILNYDGVVFSPANVASGGYAIWGYEHIVNRAGGLSANQGLVRDALIAAITDATYQTTAIYANNFVALADMHVERGADGGTITSLDF